MKKVLAIVGRIFAFLIISLLIGFNVFLLNARLVLHEPLPMLCGYGYAIVVTGSMQPTLNINDLVIVQQCESYEAGDIVSFVDAHNDLVTHRLVSINDSANLMVTQGDANNVTDLPLEADRIKGKVIHILPGVGNVITFLQNPLCVLVLIVVMIFLLERSYRSAKKRRQSELDKLRREIERLKAETAPTSPDILNPDASRTAEALPDDLPAKSTDECQTESTKDIPPGPDSDAPSELSDHPTS